jgi:hypothetical protein
MKDLENDSRVDTFTSRLTKAGFYIERIMKIIEHTGKIVRFKGNNGNQFRNNDIAICMDGEEKLFLGLSGENFLRTWYESLSYEILPTFKPDLEELLADARCNYFEAR